ncbi:MAG: SRPBCC family protein [Candidatus Aenigmarchaeota archaeon]|nr:SRPBCC family protein [Candidatus Aenigmarchaeota archaeon]
MHALMESRTLSVSIGCDHKEVYEFASNPENLPKWAKSFCISVKKSGNLWIAETPSGPVKIEFVERNAFGVMDHCVIVSGTKIFNAMRVLRNAKGSEMLFTVFRQPGIEDKKYNEDIGLIETDLAKLKAIMESRN